MADDDRLIATVAKNGSEEIRLTLGEYKGHSLFSARVYYRDRQGGEFRPSKAGISIRVAALPDFARAIEAALAEAISAGLIEGNSGELSGMRTPAPGRRREADSEVAF